jgi:hypothetical protein
MERCGQYDLPSVAQHIISYELYELFTASQDKLSNM